MSKKQPDFKSQIDELKKRNEALQAECEMHRKERRRLASLYVLWRKSALRYQKIAAALSHAYYTSHVLYGDEYGEDVIAAHKD